jgi:hypothetical protein
MKPFSFLSAPCSTNSAPGHTRWIRWKR